jgi:CO/xanthine dehydrogenase Mo-binding subunit
MSMGRGIYEGLVRDNNSGIALSPNYLEYRLPTHMDIPNMDIELVNEIDPYGPFGAKGVAEPMLDAPAPAIANAIYNACGARVNNTPITPDKILWALGKA